MRNYFKQKVLPAVTLSSPDLACSLAEALLKGGITVLEVTFRTGAAAASIKKITEEFPELTVGAGTIISPGQITDAMEAGARFGLAPGLNKNIIQTAQKHDFPFIPGVMTPSEIEQALEQGCKLLKVFPVKQIGGVEFIRSMEGPYAHTGVQFIPMGGVHTGNLKDYLTCRSVLAAGGSWLTPGKLVQQKDFRKITEIARASVEIAGVGKTAHLNRQSGLYNE